MSTFSKQINRFKQPLKVEENYNYFNFNGNLKSDCFKDLQFTNYVSSEQCNKYKELLNISKKIKNNEKEWDKLFIADEIDINVNIPKLDRIYKIISEVNKKEIKREELILKFKYKDDKEIQFYVKNESGVLTLYLIDLYHIGIEAVNKKTKRTDRKGIYNARKKCNYDIKNIAIKLNIDSNKR